MNSQSAPRPLSFETGKLAKQADGSVIVRLGDTMVLVTACYAANPREGIDFLPLTVDYKEYTYASGRIPGGFFKREGKPSEKEVLTSRVIDRPIRPLFPSGWRHETQVIALVLSADTRERLGRARDHRRVGRAGDLGDPVPEDDRRRARRPGGRRVRHQSDLRAAEAEPPRPRRGRSAGTAIVMVEAGAKEASEEEVVAALEAAHAAIKQIVAVIDDLAKDGRQARSARSPKKEIAHDFYREVEEKVLVPLTEAMRLRGKLENYDRVDRCSRS